MFMHRNRGRHAQAVSLGMLTAALITTAARAAETPNPFVFVAYSNRAGGEHLASGEYTTAAQALHRRKNTGISAAQALDTNNRCVACAMTQQPMRARAACDAAVRDAQSADNALLSSNPQTRQTAAVAYSNRAVLRSLHADLSAAQQDLARAEALAPQASLVMRNVTAMRAHQTAALQSAASAAPAGAQE